MRQFVFYLSINVLLIISSCSEDKELPCAGAVLPSVDIETISVVEDSLFNEDTFLVPFRSEIDVTFSVAASDQDYDSLAWQVGSDPRTFTEPSFTLRFDERDIGEVNVALTVWRARNECFPDDTVVTLQKQIQLLSQENTPYAFEGTFTGYNESDPARTFDVTIVNFGRFPPPTDDTQYWLHIHNLTEGCGGEEISATSLIPGMEMASYSHFYINESAIVNDNCRAIEGYGQIDSTGNLIIDYTYRIPDTGEEVEDRFIGERKSS